jgi:hypothetical protein
MAILIGYTATSQQYLLYHIASKREFLARDVQFNEGHLYSELLASGSQESSSTVTFEIPAGKRSIFGTFFCSDITGGNYFYKN